MTADVDSRRPMAETRRLVAAPPRALLYEVDPLVGERLRSMLRSEGFATCLVDDLALFEVLASGDTFHLYAVGVIHAGELAALPEKVASLDSLLVLAPLAGESGVSPFRVALPRATLVDRGLRDTDVIRRLLAPALGREQGGAQLLAPSISPDSIARAFGSFGLSDRQLEVLGRALRGERNAEIGARLFISELTVRNHLHAIYERVGVSGRRELLGRFVQGLADAHA
jgi:DNA-binding CsgD family transcriptional regulator